MLSNRIKKIVIAEYIKISNIYKIISHSHATNNEYIEITEAIKKLKCKYELVLFRSKCIDLAFAILKKELNSIDVGLYEIDNVECFYANVTKTIKEYSNGLNKKMKLLSFNDFEINFVENFN